MQALQEVSFELRRGEVLALAGHNGAGKSTLIGVLAGTVRPDRGSVEVFGDRFELAGPADTLRAGIGVCYQEPRLVPHLSVAANVFLKREQRTAWGFLDRDDIRERYRELQELTAISLPGESLVAELSVAQRQLVQILRAFAGGGRIIILDEPTAALSPSDREHLFDVVRALSHRRDSVSFIVASHFLDELEANCHRAIVLRSGRVVADREGPPVAGELSSLMTTRPDSVPTRPPGPRRTAPGPPLLRVEQLVAQGAKPVGISVGEGEIVGLAGLVGSGRTELLRAIALGDGRTAGTVTMSGLPVANARASLRRGLAMLGESRARSAMSDWPIWKNITLPALPKVSGSVFLRPKKEISAAAALADRCHVVCHDMDQRFGELSGGNQQKVLFAKLLFSDFRVALLDEPTHGVDVHAKAEILRIIEDLAAEGRGFVIVAAEFEDLLSVCTRVLSIHKGSIVAEHHLGTTHRVTSELLLLECATGRPSPGPPQD
ncbi:sugar ABC transporter ATP-binding protein [Streptomyces sp. BE303]|uniref:sugar ABC transporter ATP-binding protein n=1 Tax=Streptomyces sp. BE303 TaxID=3002528 RepID=UPI002E767716|nr:sugar ABC transporter ATP-binding protein [Streptomyces sp. BE303]MED7950054.1 sugar ABC transporter ATP-binding protein [Streptomyces sp. BE303]